uniref:Uncharacterized protein n=1 Tax=Stegastes partitus TaxID=144197 RepID=A0A3B5BHZ9_9TELE
MTTEFQVCQSYHRDCEAAVKRMVNVEIIYIYIYSQHSLFITVLCLRILTNK